VFGTIPNISELADDIGVNAEQVGTNVNAVDYSLFEPMTENFRNVIEEGIEATYTTFLSRVAEGRNISMSEADSLAQGRVWSGVDAQRLGLVDELGGLQDAVEAAATMAEISEYSIRKYPRYKSGFERFMEDFEGTSAEAQEALIKEEIGDEFYSVLKELQGVLKQKGIQARMPFTLNIK
jgi:protease-4